MSADASSSGTPPLGSSGGVRGDAYPVEVVVTSGDQPEVGIAVTFTETDIAADPVSATTDSDGVASVTLVAGSYTVAASSGDGSATTSIEVVASTDPLIVPLALAPAAQ